MRLPATAAIGVTHERVATPLMCTVHAPHCAMPQPNLVPVRPSVSRSTQSSGVSGLSVMLRALPLTVRVIGGIGGAPQEVRSAPKLARHTGRWKGDGASGNALLRGSRREQCHEQSP